MEFRHFYLGQELVRMGHNVTIVAASYSHLRKKQPLINGRFTSEVICGLKYYWIRSAPYKTNGVKRFWNILTFIGNVFLLSKMISQNENPMVIINSSTYPMDIWPAKFLAKKSKAKLIFELHDLWPMSPKEIGGMSDRHPFIKLCQIAENTIYKSVDGVVSILPNVHEYVCSRGIALKDLLICPNGFKLSEIERNITDILREEIKVYIAQAKQQNRIVVVYAGAMGLANALDNLLDCAKILSNSQFSFVLVGSGLESERLLGRVKLEEISNLKMFDPIKKSEVFNLLELCDIGYLGAPKLELYRYGVSQNKFVDYTLASLPIINATEARNNVIEDIQCGYTIEPDNPGALANVLLEFALMAPHDREEMGRRGREYTVSNLNYQAIGNELSEFLGRL